MTPERDEKTEHRDSGGHDGLTVVLWLLAVVLAEYLFLAWAILHARPV